METLVMETPCASGSRKSRVGGVLTLLALISLMAAYAVGFFVQGNESFQTLQKAFPGKQLETTEGSSELYSVTDLKTHADEGHIVTRETLGWGGPLTTATWIGSDEIIREVAVLSHKETPSFFQHLEGNGFFEQFAGRSITAPLTNDGEIDAVSGATISSVAFTKAVREGSHRVAAEQYGHPMKKEAEAWNVGRNEIVLLIVFAVVIGCLLLKRMKARLFVLAFCILFLGIHMNRPISLASLASILLGYLPSLHSQPFWWLLVPGVLLITTLMGKNVYCYWMCPFGGMQEFATKIGGVSFRLNKKVTGAIKHLVYLFLWMALMIIFLTRNPAMGAYEPFATLFSLRGSGIQWTLVTVALAGSFLIPRFWCRFFCPVGVILNRLARLKKRIKKKWASISPRPKEALHED